MSAHGTDRRHITTLESATAWSAHDSQAHYKYTRGTAEAAAVPALPQLTTCQVLRPVAERAAEQAQRVDGGRRHDGAHVREQECEPAPALALGGGLHIGEWQPQPAPLPRRRGVWRVCRYRPCVKIGLPSQMRPVELSIKSRGSGRVGTGVKGVQPLCEVPGASGNRPAACSVASGDEGGEGEDEDGEGEWTPRAFRAGLC